MQAAILVFFVPLVSVLIFFLLNRIWSVCQALEKKRWLYFLIPGAIIAMILTARFFVAPSVQHELKIIPSEGQSGRIELYEIKAPAGRVVNLSRIDRAGGWTLENNTLVTDEQNPGILTYSFFGPIGDDISLLFSQSLESRDVIVVLDGREQAVELNSSDAGLKAVEISTSYKAGIPAILILLPVAVVDFLAFFFFLLFLWLVIELPQTMPDKTEGRFPFSHLTGLVILLAVSLLLHVPNFFAVPLLIDADSPSYLQGAVHWAEHGNLDGVPFFRGPGTTFLFIPAFLFFGNDPWGVKLVLHLMAIGSVFVSYRLGWQLFQRRSFAFFAGLITLLIPETFFYSNFVMSDMPNIFFGLLFCSLLLSTLETFSWRWLLPTMLTASFLTLLRPENVILLVIAGGFLPVKLFIEHGRDISQFRRAVQMLGVSVLVAVIPLLLWAARNDRLHGFFGLSNYSGEVLYTGWVYYGEASGLPFIDTDSEAVGKINKAVEAYSGEIDYRDVPTGWELYPALVEYGYTSGEAFELLGDAAKDSMRKDWKLTLDLLWIKVRKSLVPENIPSLTFPLSEERTDIPEEQGQKAGSDLKEERSVFPVFIHWQRAAYEWVNLWYRYFYYPVFLLSLGMMFLALYQRRFFAWAPVVVITASRVFIPIVFGLGNWRYVVSGLVFMPLFFLLAVYSAMGFLSMLRNGEPINPKPE